MQPISAHSPQYTSTGNIDLVVLFDDLSPEEVPFTSTPADEYGLYTRAAAGEFGPVTPSPERTLEQAKSEKYVEIEQDRDFECVQNTEALGHTWQATMRSQDLITKALVMAQAGLGLPASWRDADNIDVPITSVSDLNAIAGPMMAATEAAYIKSWDRKAQCDAATTIEDVDSI